MQTFLKSCFTGRSELGEKVLTVCYYHVTYEFQSQPTLYSLPECEGTPCSTQATYLKFK